LKENRRERRSGKAEGGVIHSDLYGREKGRSACEHQKRGGTCNEEKGRTNVKIKKRIINVLCGGGGGGFRCDAEETPGKEGGGGGGVAKICFSRPGGEKGYPFDASKGDEMGSLTEGGRGKGSGPENGGTAPILPPGGVAPVAGEGRERFIPKKVGKGAFLTPWKRVFIFTGGKKGILPLDAGPGNRDGGESSFLLPLKREGGREIFSGLHKGKRMGFYRG